MDKLKKQAERIIQDFEGYMGRENNTNKMEKKWIKKQKD